MEINLCLPHERTTTVPDVKLDSLELFIELIDRLMGALLVPVDRRADGARPFGGLEQIQDKLDVCSFLHGPNAANDLVVVL